MKKRVLIVSGVGVLLLLGAGFLFWSPPLGAGIPCPTYALTGLYCAGCGASRALRSLLHLQVYQAFRYNPLLVLLTPWIGLYVVVRAVDYIRTGGNHVDRKLSFRALYVLAVLVIVYGVARNIPVWPFTLLRPTLV